ncbi:type IV secretion system protein [Paraburkholderia aromaticivorans]|uniref:Conjugal transfer protein TrbL n=1 Tax=Paraburkholderia aromaticivorans TaxID=2026199 RepID=A0A248VZZ1_9BURK|nr:type IV secretion system protein [Paraburkholderia aromaticivorans]ASW04423.1 conjugal transfer protein TrbL [Paraburkholderia aromaticivorans]
MAYDGVTQIFNYMDTVTTQVVAENMSRIIGWAAPIAALGLVIQLTIDGLATMLRPSGEPLSQLVEKFVKYFAIVAIAGAGGLYATTLANTAMHLPDEMASILLLHGSTGGSDSAVAGMIDAAIDHSLTVTRNLFKDAGVMTETGLVSLILGVVVIGSTMLICGISAISILLAKFLLAVTVCFGPIFILLLITPPLVSFFGNWLGSVFNYIVLIAMTAMSFGVFMRFYDLAISAAAKPNPDQAVLAPIITAGIITVMAVVLLKSLPDLAARWTGGVSTKLAQHLPQPRPGSSGGGGGKGSGGGSSGSGSGSGGGTGSGSGSAGGSSGSSSGGSGGYSYARGSQGSGSYGGGSSSSSGGSSPSSSGSGSASNASGRGSQSSQSNS